ncbi:MAG: hypothetical protein WBB45_09730 [Cyclobacteriaceae bacterium]
MNRLYIYFRDTRYDFEELCLFRKKLSDAFSEVRPYCTIVIDNRAIALPERFKHDIKFNLVTQSLQKPVHAFAEVIKAHYYSILPHHTQTIMDPFQPVFKKFTSLDAAEVWLNNLKAI